MVVAETAAGRRWPDAARRLGDDHGWAHRLALDRRTDRDRALPAAPSSRAVRGRARRVARPRRGAGSGGDPGLGRGREASRAPPRRPGRGPRRGPTGGRPGRAATPARDGRPGPRAGTRGTDRAPPPPNDTAWLGGSRSGRPHRPDERIARQDGSTSGFGIIASVTWWSSS